MRPSARSIISGLAVLAAGSVVASAVAGCSASAGQAYDHHPAKTSAPAVTSSAPASTVPQAVSTAAPSSPTPRILVAGAPRGVKAKAGILADAATGQVLWAKDATVQRPIASIAKVMTAYLVIQGGDLDRKIVIPKGVLNYVWKYGANSAGLVPGNVLTVDELLHALLITSAADAAYTLATTYGPGVPAFVAKMNATAQQLGLTHTHFTSPDGLPYPTETSTYSTPVELLKLGEAAMQSPEFRSIVDERFYSLKKGPGHRSYWWGNSNELIGYYPGAIGIKTGYTDQAGHCLLFEAVRGGRTLIGVVLGSPPTGPSAGAQDAARVLNWGFALKQSG